MRDFLGPEGRADLAVVIVTYNSADDIDGLIESLRPEARSLALRVIVVDNSSGDETLALVRAHADVLPVPSGGNLGYAAGINVASRHIGEAEATLILNPDLRVEHGAVREMLAAMRAHARAGVIVPRIVGADGHIATSLHNEPGVTRALVDAVLGPIWSSRPAALSEWVRAPRAYRAARRTDWATGAAMLVSAEAAAAVGAWDERFFLYSEETDFCRRARDAGFEIWFDPSATVQHSQGGSGSSPELDALLHVNRVRYMRKHAPRRAGVYRWVVLLAESIRSRAGGSHRLVAAYLRDESRWKELPKAMPDTERVST